jgi:hypothetical protein
MCNQRRVVIIAIFSDHDTDRTITIVDRDRDQKKIAIGIEIDYEIFGQFVSITRQLSLAKSVSIEIALTAQVSFTFFLEYCQCFSECKMAQNGFEKKLGRR